MKKIGKNLRHKGARAFNLSCDRGQQRAVQPKKRSGREEACSWRFCGAILGGNDQSLNEANILTGQNGLKFVSGKIGS